MNCKKCGTEIPRTCKCCPECGAKIHNTSVLGQNKKIITTILIAFLIACIISSVRYKTENNNVEKGKIVYADQAVAEEVAYDYAANILLTGLPSDYENFVNTTTIDWEALFSKLNESDNSYGEPQDVYRDFLCDNKLFESVAEGYSYYKIETVSVTDYPYTQLHKNITLFSNLFRPLSLSAVKYIPFSDIHTLNSVILSVEFYDENDSIIATEQLDITVVADSEEYYGTRYYSVLNDNFFIEKFITSLYPEDTSTVLHR